MDNQPQGDFGEQMRALNRAFEEHRESTNAYREESRERQKTIIEAQRVAVDQLQKVATKVDDIDKTVNEVERDVKEVDQALRGDLKGTSGLLNQMNTMKEKQSTQSRWMWTLGLALLLTLVGAIVRGVLK